MDKGKGAKALASSLQNLDLNSGSKIKSKSSITFTHPQFPGLLTKKTKPPSLVSLCIGVIGRNLEDIIADLDEIATNLPADIKIAVAAIARRRKLLNDDVLIALADTSWEILDVSGSDVTDSGLIKAAEVCRFIKTLDISRCTKITATGMSELVKHCHLLETLRCGGCPRSDNTARRCLSIFKPRLDYVEEDSWEELDTKEITSGAQSLRWLVWPNIDNNSLEDISSECPRIVVNPKSSPFGFMVTQVPWEALQDIVLDDAVVKDIDPRTWTVHGFAVKPISPSPSSSSSTELSVAEKFRLAFVERDNRLAPKRAKNARQHQRRAVRELMLMSTRAKAVVLASQVSKSLHGRNL
ncbi:Leucine-rich repeat, cysteine-containing subtype [Sesbania bispinosa]|nr:Leucine-rich repeat, cysteine-containing subtype [Sesbania bispinosa]